MSEDWYHATPDGGRHGPMRADDLVRLFQAGRIHGATPVWREGQPGWAPLSSVAGMLGLAAVPPPVPPAVQPPPRRGLHWFWIVLLVVAGLAVPVIAILAAIAIPAYNDYRLRAGIAEIAATATPLRLAVESAVTENGLCPLTASPDTGAGSDASVGEARALLLAHRHVENVRTSAPASPTHCDVSVQLSGFDRDGVDGEVLTWSFDPAPGTWTCQGTVANRYLPATCRP